MAARIRLDGVHYRYPGTGWILNGIDLTLDAGEYTTIFGSNGSGKSSLAYLLNGLIPHFFGGLLEGMVTVNGIDTKNSSVSELFSHVGLVLQNADAQLFNSTVENEIAFGLESLGIAAGEIDRRISDISAALNIEELLDRSPETLSGGEKRLVSIAAMLCLNPSFLLLDEPYSNLDWKGVRAVRNNLLQIHQSGRNVVIIEQRLGRFLQDANRCVVIEHGQIRFDGAVDAAGGVMENQHLIPHYPRRLRQHSSTYDDTILAVKDLSCFIGGRSLLKKISLEFKKGQTVAIVGENGAGKTTLIKHFNGLLRPTEGEVVLDGESIRRKSPAELARRVGVCFQNPNDQFFKVNVRDELMVGPRIIGKEGNNQVEQACRMFDLHALMDRSPYRLSEGEKKRVAVASILAMQPDILVLDEPTVGQDGRFKEAMAKILGTFENLGITTIIVTHDLDFARATADRWIVLQEGQVMADGSPEDIRHDEQLILKGVLERPADRQD